MDKLEPTPPNIVSTAKHVGAQKIVVLIGTTLPFTTMQVRPNAGWSYIK